MQLESSVTLFDDNKVESKFAQLEITADGITSEVSRKVGNDEVISRINQSAEEVKIQANRVNIEGATIFSTGRLSQDNLNNAYDSNGAAAGQVNTLKSDLAASSGTTVIHGGHITTGTLDADTINANSGTFNTANIPDLNASKITAGTLSADRIGANSIGADKIKVSEIEIGAAQIASGTIDSARIPNLSATKITTDKLDTARLNISGVITAINNNGTTTIDGGKITTNSIGANKIKVAELVTIGPSTGAHAHVTSNGLDVYGNDGENTVAQFGATARIGKAAASHVNVAADGLHIWKGAESTLTNEIGKFTSDEVVLTNINGSYITDTKLYTHNAISYLLTSARTNVALGGMAIVNVSSNEDIRTAIAIGSSHGGLSNVYNQSDLVLTVSALHGLNLVSSKVTKFTVTNGGNISAAGTLTLSGHSTAVGSILTANGTKSIAKESSSYASTGVSISLPAGSWAVTYSLSYPGNSTGNRAAVLYFDGTKITCSECKMAPVNTAERVLTGTMFVENTTSSNKDATVYTWSTATAALTATVYMRAIRIA